MTQKHKKILTEIVSNLITKSKFATVAFADMDIREYVAELCSMNDVYTMCIVNNPYVRFINYKDGVKITTWVFDRNTMTDDGYSDYLHKVSSYVKEIMGDKSYNIHIEIGGHPSGYSMYVVRSSSDE